MGSEYAKGYAAGRKRRKTDAAERAFWQRTFLSCLPAAFLAEGWARGQEPISGLSDRVALAREFADEALEQARKNNRI